MATGDNHPAWLIGGFQAGLTPGQSKSGFEMTLRRPACCFTAIFGPGGGPAATGDAAPRSRCPRLPSPGRGPSLAGVNRPAKDPA